MAGGAAFVEESATPDGSLALGEAMSQGGSFLGAATVDRATEKMTIIRAFSNPQTQVVSMASDANWIAWVEGSIQPNLADWVLYCYNRKTGHIRMLAAAPKPDGIHYPNTAFVLISMSHGVIVWSAIEGTDGDYQVYAANADGSGLQTLAANAAGPQIVWPWVMYVAKSTLPGAGTHLVLRDLQSGQVRDVASPSNFAYFAFDGQSVAWISADTNDLYMMAPIGSSRIHVASGRYLQFVSMTSRLIGWGQDREGHQPVREHARDAG